MGDDLFSAVLEAKRQRLREKGWHETPTNYGRRWFSPGRAIGIGVTEEEAFRILETEDDT